MRLVVNAVESFQKIIQNPEKALSVLKYRTFSVLGISNVRRFIVLSRSRTGSNMLISLLRSHPNICARGEVVGKLDGRNYKDVLADAFTTKSHLIKASGFKLFYYHPLDDDSGDLWQDLVNMDDLYVIHLKRRNVLRILISRKIAESMGQWIAKDTLDIEAQKDQAQGNKCVYMSVEELTNGFQQTRAWEKRGDAIFSSHPLITVYYEDLLDELEDNFRKITDFLDLPFVLPETSLRKQNPEQICDLLENYYELRESFKGTEWQTYFEE